MSDLFYSLITFALIATASPGGATTLATASGIQFGFARSVPLIAGIAVGMATLIGLVGGGLGTLVASVPQLQFGLRLIGSLYLLWLAWQISNTAAPNAKTGVAAAPLTFAKGMLLLWLNPKGWTLAVASASAYAAITNSPAQLLFILGTVFGLAALVSLTLWCISGQWLSQVIKTDRAWRAFNIALALLLAASIIPMWR